MRVLLSCKVVSCQLCRIWPPDPCHKFLYLREYIANAMKTNSIVGNLAGAASIPSRQWHRQALYAVAGFAVRVVIESRVLASCKAAFSPSILFDKPDLPQS
jgi:hypothetical protein